jgi:hypothetical protein
MMMKTLCKYFESEDKCKLKKYLEKIVIEENSTFRFAATNQSVAFVGHIQA